MSENTEKQTAPSFTRPSLIDPSELEKAFKEEGLVAETPAVETDQQKPPVVESKPAEKQEVKPPVADQKVAEEVPALVKIAQERAALRRESETVKPYLEALKVLSPTEVQRLAQARAAGDPVAALKAIGFDHSQYTAKMLSLKGEEQPAPEAEKPSASPDLEQLKQEVASLKQEREAERFAASRQQALTRMREVLKDDPKFSHVRQLEDYEGVEALLTAYWNENKTLPGDTFEESVKLAAEAREVQLKKEAARWQKVLSGDLTSSSSGAGVQTKKAPESQPSTGSAAPRTLTNANTTAPAVTRPPPKSREEIINAILDGRDHELES